MKSEVIVKSRNKEAFELAFQLAFLNGFEYKEKKDFKAIGYMVKNNELFISQYSKECTKFAYDFNVQQTIDFAWGWWEANKKPSEREPDTDGSTGIGFEISTKRCGIGSEDWGMFVSVKPVWFIYGK